MADDIQSSFKELVSNASKEKSDFKGFAMLCLGLVVGLFLGYQMNLEKSAAVMARDSCGICQDNVAIMVSDYNIVVKQLNACIAESPTLYQVRNIPILPGVINQTVSVYAS